MIIHDTMSKCCKKIINWALLKATTASIFYEIAGEELGKLLVDIATDEVIKKLKKIYSFDKFWYDFPLKMRLDLCEAYDSFYEQKKRKPVFSEVKQWMIDIIPEGIDPSRMHIDEMIQGVLCRAAIDLYNEYYRSV